MSRCHARRLFPLTFLLLILLPACSSSDGDGSDGNSSAGFSGTWDVSLDGVTTQTCSGDLEGVVITFCDDYEVTIMQTGNTVSGTFDAPCFPASGSLTGTISGGILSGTLTLTTGPETTHTEFSATVSGQMIVIMFDRLTLDGFTGECVLSGTWSGPRL